MEYLTGYFEIDKGKFDSALVRRANREVIACTAYDRVKAFVSGTVDSADRKAVVAFAEQYDLPIYWGC